MVYFYFSSLFSFLSCFYLPMQFPGWYWWIEVSKDWLMSPYLPPSPPSVWSVSNDTMVLLALWRLVLQVLPTSQDPKYPPPNIPVPGTTSRPQKSYRVNTKTRDWLVITPFRECLQLACGSDKIAACVWFIWLRSRNVYQVTPERSSSLTRDT